MTTMEKIEVIALFMIILQKIGVSIFLCYAIYLCLPFKPNKKKKPVEKEEQR